MEISHFIERIKNFIDKHKIFVQNEPIIVAISGGADSVALLLTLQKLGYHIHALHCNFHLRGEESMRDEMFVRSLCTKLGISLLVENFDTKSFAANNHLSIEMACRELRYAWFRQYAQTIGCTRIAVAHHCDDSIETFFLNALRGSGISGLAAIKPLNGDIARPLLCVNRNDIEQFLANCNQNYVTDSSNLCCDFKRNKLRNIILHQLYSVFPDAKTGLLTTISNNQSCNALYSELIEQALSKICVKANPLVIKTKELLKFNNSETLLFELLRKYNFNAFQVNQLFNSISDSGKHIISASHIATISRDLIEVCEIKECENFPYKIDLCNDIVRPISIAVKLIDAQMFSIKQCDGKTSVGFDHDIQNQKLFIRHWQKGDRIKPFGMTGSKLVSDVFNDLKLTDSEKRNAWLLVNNFDEVLWVIGYKSSNHFRITKNSKFIYLLKIT